jgi:hypothetical protein
MLFAPKFRKWKQLNFLNLCFNISHWCLIVLNWHFILPNNLESIADWYLHQCLLAYVLSVWFFF